MAYQNRNIHLKGIFVDFVKTRPTSDLDLVFEDHAGVKYKSEKFENGVLIYWDLDIHVRTHTSATLTVRQLDRAHFKIRVAKMSVKIEPREFGDDRIVCLEDSNHRITVTFVCGSSQSATIPNTVAPIDTQLPHRRIQELSFRVLIIGRANAGKTSILQRICETTESPIIYRGDEEVTLDPSMDRGEHQIDDELVFSNHPGYVFHDSRGIESGGTEELKTLHDFIKRKCGETRLSFRLHAIWYCVPMDNQRPQLDLKFFKDICPDRNVPVIAVFTKFDQFRRNVQIHVEDFGSSDNNEFDEVEKRFQEYYVRPLGNGVRFVRLEKMHMPNMRCDKLIETTAAALNDDIIELMFLGVQRGNLELGVKRALQRVRSLTGSSDAGIKDIIRECLYPFPYIWYYWPWQQQEEPPEELPPLEPWPRLQPWLEEREFSALQQHFITQIMSLPTVQILTRTRLGDYHLIFAVIIILKHATFLRLSKMSSESASTHAEVDYRKANIDSSIRQYLTPPSQEHSDELFAGFIMATDVTCTHIGVPGDSGR